MKDRKFMTTETLVLGVLLAVVLISAAINSEKPLVHDPIQETVLVALWLAGVVAFCGFKMPTLFAARHPRLAIFVLLYMSGQISWFFDSFAVVLLLRSLEFRPWEGETRFSHRFSHFAILCIGAFNALTAGGCLFIGELWGLPYYLSSGNTNLMAGLPLATVIIPYTLATSFIGAWLFPVKVTPVPFDAKQIKGGLLFIFFLGTYIYYHDVLLSVGIFLLTVSILGRMEQMIKGLLHEMEQGAFAAIGLILVALTIRFGHPVFSEWFQGSIDGFPVLIAAALSSPFAGAMIRGAHGYGEFYTHLSYLMCGAPMFVWSSLVALMVFKDTINVEDLPLPLRGIKFVSTGPHMQELVGYTLVVLPMIVGLLFLLQLGLWTGWFAWLGESMMGPWDMVVSPH